MLIADQRYCLSRRLVLQIENKTFDSDNNSQYFQLLVVEWNAMEFYGVVVHLLKTHVCAEHLLYY